MPSKPSLSLIIPCLNEAEYLPRLLKDLTEQTFTDFEVIVVDGNSDDQTKDKAQSFANKLSLKVLNTNKRNVAHQRNLGAKQAKSDWLIFMDADNSLSKTILEDLMAKITKTKVDGFTTFIEPDSGNAKDKGIARMTNYSIYISAIINAPLCYGALLGVKRTSFEQLNGFDTTLKLSEDWDFSKRLAKNNLIFKCFPDISFTCSFRRLRKEGHFKMLKSTALIHLNNIGNFIPTIDSDYPMLGGSYYEHMHREKQSILNQLSDVARETKKLTSKQQHSLKEFLKHVLDIEIKF